MTEAAQIRTLALAIGLAAAPLLRRRLPPERRAEILGLLKEVNRVANATGDAAAPEREGERALARWAIETYANLTPDRAGLALLDDLLQLLDALRVEWPDIIGAVNGMSERRFAAATESRLPPAQILARLEHGARAIAERFYPTGAS